MTFCVFRGSRFLVSSITILCISMAVTYAGDEQPNPDIPVYKNPAESIDARLDDLIARMSVEEKIAQIVTIWNGKKDILNDDLQLDAAKVKKRIPLGLGQFARPSDAIGPGSPREISGRDAAQTINLVNALQKHATEETRLGIPILFHEEGLHGYAAVGATSFPQAIALASTWDPELVKEVNSITAREIRARGVHLVL